MGLGDYWKVGEKRALSFIVFLTCGKHWPILVPREPISSTEEVSCHPGGRTWLNPAWCKKGKRKSQHNRKWKVRSPRSFCSRNCIGVLSSESTFELEFCGTFTKALKCNTLLLCHSFTKMMCQSATEPYLFLSSIVCKKHILLYLSIPGAGTMTIQQEDPISFSTRKNRVLHLAFFLPYNSKQFEIHTAKEEIHVLSFGNLPTFREKGRNK